MRPLVLYEAKHCGASNLTLEHVLYISHDPTPLLALACGDYTAHIPIKPQIPECRAGVVAHQSGQDFN